MIEQRKLSTATTARVFLSYSRPVEDYQASFLELMLTYLGQQAGIDPVVLGNDVATAYDPLTWIIESIDACSGLIALAFRRNLIGRGTQRQVLPDGTVLLRELENEWLTSSYCHIEVALAFQRRLPLLIVQESDVVQEGVLDRSSTGTSVFEFEPTGLPVDLTGLVGSPLEARIEAWLREVRARRR